MSRLVRRQGQQIDNAETEWRKRLEEDKRLQKERRDEEERRKYGVVTYERDLRIYQNATCTECGKF